MQTRHRMFDDAARLAGGALGTFAGMRREIEALARQQLDRLIDNMELVTRDEFEAVKAMAAAAREENERLAQRLEMLEGGRKGKPAAASKVAGAKPAGRKGASRPASGGRAQRKGRRSRG